MDNEVCFVCFFTPPFPINRELRGHTNCLFLKDKVIQKNRDIFTREKKLKVCNSGGMP